MYFFSFLSGLAPGAWSKHGEWDSYVLYFNPWGGETKVQSQTVISATAVTEWSIHMCILKYWEYAVSNTVSGADQSDMVLAVAAQWDYSLAAG